MKVIVDIDEKFPIYSFKKPYSHSNVSIDIPEELYKEFIDVQEKYEKMQEKLGVYYEKYERFKSDPSQDSLWVNMLENIKRIYRTPQFIFRPSSTGSERNDS